MSAARPDGTSCSATVTRPLPPSSRSVPTTAAASSSWRPDVRSHRQRRQEEKPHHVVEVEVRQRNVNPLHPVQQGRVGDEPSKPGPCVDQQYVVAPANVEATGLPLPGGDEAAAAQQPHLHLRPAVARRPGGSRPRAAGHRFRGRETRVGLRGTARRRPRSDRVRTSGTGEGTAVGRRELTEQVVTAVQHALEEAERTEQLATELLDPPLVGRGPRSLGLDLVRRPLPDPVEPVEEDVELRPPRRVTEKDGGAGKRSSRKRRIAVESARTCAPSTSTGTRSWPLSSRTARRSAGSTSTHSTSTRLWPSARATRSTLVE